MGGNFTNVSGNSHRVIIDSVIGGDILEQVCKQHGDVIAAALKDVEKMVQRQQNEDVTENFRLLSKAIAQRDATPGVARTHWERLTAAIPAILQSPAAAAILGSILR